MEAYALHLAMAALVGASVVALSAYCMHRKTLSQLLDLAKSLDQDRDRNGSNNLIISGGGRRKGNAYSYYRRGSSSSSLPDVTAMPSSAGGIDADDKIRNAPGMLVDGIPPGLPRLSTLPEGKSPPHTKRSGSLLRPSSPMSPVATATPFESVDGSDDEDDMTGGTKIDVTYLHTNGSAVSLLFNVAGDTLSCPLSKFQVIHY